MKHWPVLVALLLAWFAFRQVTSFAYTGIDSSEWILQSDPRSLHGWQWSLASPHFVGYRPLTAITYALDTLRGNLDPATYHRTDLAAHLLLVLLAYAIGAELLGRWLGLLVAIIVGIDPIGAHVVPVLARRGDLLVSVCSALALLAALRARVLACGIATALAFASKEVAVVLPPVLALAGYLSGAHREGACKKSLRLGVAAALGIAVLGGVRLAVVGRVGGYPPGERASGLRIAGEFITNLFLPSAQMFTTPEREAEWRTVFLIVAIASLVSAFLTIARRDAPREVRVALGIGLCWLGLQLGLWLITRTFFVRLLYPALLPLALIVCAPLRRARWFQSLAILPVGVTLLALVTGPLVRGVPEWQAASSYQTRVIDALEAKLAEDAWIIGVVNYPMGVRCDAASRVTRMGALPVQSQADHTEILGPTHLGAWVSARMRRSTRLGARACVTCHDLQVFHLNGIQFDAADVTAIPVTVDVRGESVHVLVRRGSYRSYRNPFFIDRREAFDTPNQALTKTRQELRVPKLAKLFVFDGGQGDLLPFPEQLEIEFKD